MRLRRIAGISLVILLIVAGIYYGFRPQPLLVEAVQVLRAPLRVTIEEEGKTRVVDRYVVSAPVAGTAHRVELDVGDTVSKGQALVSLSPLRSTALDPRSRAEAEARLSVTQAALRAAEQAAQGAVADADYYARELERVKELYEEGSVSVDRLQQADAAARRTAAERRSAEFQVEVSQFEVESARTKLRCYKIETSNSSSPERVEVVSPVAGSVLKVLHESAGTVQAGQPLIEVGDPRSLEVEVDVLSIHAVRISPGIRVLFDRWGGEEPLEGQVRRVEPTGFTKISALGVEEQRVLVICDFVGAAESWKRLGDGYRVEAEFILWEGQEVLQIPTSALFRDKDGWAVFTIDVGSECARLRSVEPGRRGGLQTEVLDRLEAGEMVIRHPPRELEDGSPVLPKDDIRSKDE